MERERALQRRRAERVLGEGDLERGTHVAVNLVDVQEAFAGLGLVRWWARCRTKDRTFTATRVESACHRSFSLSPSVSDVREN